MRALNGVAPCVYLLWVDGQMQAMTWTLPAAKNAASALGYGSDGWEQNGDHWWVCATSDKVVIERAHPQ